MHFVVTGNSSQLKKSPSHEENYLKSACQVYCLGTTQNHYLPLDLFILQVYSGLFWFIQNDVLLFSYLSAGQPLNHVSNLSGLNQIEENYKLMRFYSPSLSKNLKNEIKVNTDVTD